MNVTDSFRKNRNWSLNERVKTIINGRQNWKRWIWKNVLPVFNQENSNENTEIHLNTPTGKLCNLEGATLCLPANELSNTQMRLYIDTTILKKNMTASSKMVCVYNLWSNNSFLIVHSWNILAATGKHLQWQPLKYCLLLQNQDKKKSVKFKYAVRKGKRDNTCHMAIKK